jgi:phosphatidylglycerol---prolipoprotein diacylglyceryl transferase
MIPYFELREIPIGGGLSVAAFGVLVVVGIAVGIWFAQARARALGIREAEINTAMAWALIAGLIGSHLEVLLLYERDRSFLGVFEFWNGMSAFGGFFGALAGLTVYFSRRRRAWWAEADILIQALVLGWVFGRLGCTLVHDHIGAPSHFPLAIRFPDGPRHDLGLYELLYTLLVLVPAVFLLNRRPRVPGTTIWVIILLYAPARFVADFLRHTDLPNPDLRYHGLTVAQYACVVLATIGLGVLWMRRNDARAVRARAPAAGPVGSGRADPRPR